MALIVAGISSLAQHLQQLNTNPEAYRPERCPYCGCITLWGHGCYYRHPDRTNNSRNTLNPIPILRFICARHECGKTSSVLPECIAPRRWYMWSVQQAMLVLLLTDKLVTEQTYPYPRTVWRWWTRLKDCFDIHRYHLANWDSHLGQYASAMIFWAAIFLQRPLSKVMLILNQQGVVVP